MKTDREYILCAAIKRRTPRNIESYYDNDIALIEIGYRHRDIFHRFGDEVSRSPKDQGFYTSKGRFVGRKEAMRIAYEAQQLKDGVEPFQNPCDLDNMWTDLYSEDLY